MYQVHLLNLTVFLKLRGLKGLILCSVLTDSIERNYYSYNSLYLTGASDLGFLDVGRPVICVDYFNTSLRTCSRTFIEPKHILTVSCNTPRMFSSITGGTKKTCDVTGWFLSIINKSLSEGKPTRMRRLCLKTSEAAG